VALRWQLSEGLQRKAQPLHSEYKQRGEGGREGGGVMPSGCVSRRVASMRCAAIVSSWQGQKKMAEEEEGEQPVQRAM
jgi:hypothetical protein